MRDLNLYREEHFLTMKIAPSTHTHIALQLRVDRIERKKSNNKNKTIG